MPTIGLGRCFSHVDKTWMSQNTSDAKKQANWQKSSKKNSESRIVVAVINRNPNKIHQIRIAFSWWSNYGCPKVSRQFQFVHGNFNFTHGNFNLFTAISIYSRQFQFAHGNFNLFTTISICSWQFQFFPRNFNFLTATFTAFFASVTTCQLRLPTVATKSRNAKSKVDI